MRAVRRPLARTALASAIAGALSLVLVASALAVSGKPINVGTPFQSGAPAVAVDSSGTAYIAWANTKDLAPTTTNIVQYCVLPAGASACAHAGNLTPADSGQYIDGVQVLLDGSTVVLLADVYGTTAGSAGDYEPEQEWQSTDGGATFNIVDGGRSVADGIINADSAPLSAVILPGTGVLGYGWNTAGGSPPTFAAFPFASPAECSGASAPRCPYASLAPAGQPDQIGNAGGQFASQLGANPGILAVFNTDFTSGNLGCSNAKTVPFGTAYAYAAGAQSATNDYNVSPGLPNSAWRVAVAQADCNVEYPAVGGGPSGFGVLEDDELTGATVYHPFDQAHESFDTSEVTVVKQNELYPSVSQDGAGGIYATFLQGGSGGPIALAYSSDGGKSWLGPVALDPNKGSGAGNLTSSVGSSGQGWAAWTDNGSVYAQQFAASDAASASATIGGTGTSTGKTVTVTISCVVTPCTLTITITATETVVVIAARDRAGAARKRIRRTKTVTLGTGKFTIRTKGSKKLTIHLTKAGAKFLAAHHGRVKASLRVSQKLGGHSETATRTIKIVPAKRKTK